MTASVSDTALLSANLAKASPIAPADRTFDTSAAAQYTGISISTLNKLRIFGGGPVFIKYYRRVVYRKSDIDAWMNSKRRRSTSDMNEQAA